MPFRKPRKTVTKKRAPVRRPRRRVKRKTMSGPFRNYVSADPFKPTMSVKLKYTETKTMFSGAAGLTGSLRTFRLNSLYDPNYAVGGDQPYGYDQLATLYKKYKVNGALLEVVFTDPDQDGMFVAVQLQTPSASDTALTNKSSAVLREQPMTVVRTIQNSGKQRAVIKQYIPLSTVSGITKLQFMADADLFSAVTTTNPVTVPRAQIAVGSNREVTNATVVCRVSITYYATLYDRITLAQSE